MQKVWILGSSNPYADKSIPWDSTFPNFSEPDVLIIDLTTLTEEIMNRLDEEKLDQAKNFILDKFYHHGIIIVITSPYFLVTKNKHVYSNYYLTPLEIKSITVPSGKTILFDKTHDFTSYLNEVQKFSFYIASVNSEKIILKISKGSLPFYEVIGLPSQKITDNAGHILGGSYHVFRINLSKGTNDKVSNSGEVILLPPSENHDIGISKILQVFDKRTSKDEVIPEWISNISTSWIQTKEKEHQILLKEKEKIEIKILESKKEKDNLTNHLRLLYSEGTQLENAVAEAFKVLGISEFRRIRENNEEDGVFEFKHISRYKYGVLEVKGSENRTTESHLTQCNKWVDEYFGKRKEQVKGIFITNQHRLKEYPKSRKEKLHFEPREIDYANRKDICVIPSCVLFDAVNETLSGRVKSRNKIENIIADTNGILTKL